MLKIYQKLLLFFFMGLILSSGVMNNVLAEELSVEEVQDLSEETDVELAFTFGHEIVLQSVNLRAYWCKEKVKSLSFFYKFQNSDFYPSPLVDPPQKL